MEKDNQQCSGKWMELQFALEALNISSEEAQGLWAPLAAIIHLGAAGITQGTLGTRPYFASPTAARRAANVLGTTEEELSRIIFAASLYANKLRSGRSGSSLSLAEEGSGSPQSTTPTHDAAQIPFEFYQDALEGFVMGLYLESFAALIRLINRSINTTIKVNSSLYILDSPGLQDPVSVHPRSHGASFEDLCFNYAVERLQWLLHFSTFTAQLDRYNRENIDCNYEIEDTILPETILAILDKMNPDRRISYGDKGEPRGIFWTLEDESMRTNGNEISFVEKVIAHHVKLKGNCLVKPGDSSDTFTISHLQNSVEILYNSSGWLKKVKEHPTIKMAYTHLAESTRHPVADLYVGHRSGVIQVEIARTRSVKKRSQGTLAIKKNSVCMQVKIQMDSVLETLRRSNIRFIHCFLPDVNAGVFDTAAKSTSLSNSGSSKSVTVSLDVPLIRQQFRGVQALQAVRIHRQGYPEHMAYGEFRRRFDILLPRDDREKEPILDEKQAVEKMVDHMELDKRSFKLGLSQIFFRSGSLAQLEDARDDKLNDTIIHFQARCRGYLGRKNLKKLKVQYVAIKCLQRNIRKYMAVKNWSWWKLFTKVLPVLDVHRTEAELKLKTSEIETLRSKVEKLLGEKKEFSELNAKSKKKIQDLLASVSELESAANSSNDLLEQETAERINLEEELEKFRAERESFMKENDRLSTELLEVKVAQPGRNRSYDDTYEDEGDSSGDETFYKVKYKSLTREVDLLRKRLTDQAEDEFEDLISQKKQMERQLIEEKEDAEDLRRHLNNSKRKIGKLNDEMEDMKLILETSQSRNSDLEKKQRKFDQEMNNLKNEIQQERTQKEKMQKEKDQIATQKYTMETDLHAKEEDIDRLKRQVDRLQLEMDDFDKNGKTGGNDTLALKRDKRELELKLQDQEEELDEQAGQIQILDQAKLKLEMESQRIRQQFQKDLETKEDEVEQLKLDQQRKIRQLEEQIEEEYREKNEAVKGRRELERRVFELQSSVDEADRSCEKRLRKEVKKLRILYRDAKYALDNQVNQTVEKNQLKQLRNQLEDAEFAKHIALKSKKQLEADIEDLQKQLEEMSRVKQEVDDKCFVLSRDNADLLTKIDEDEDDMGEMIKKNKQLISQIASLQTELTDEKLSAQSLLDAKSELEERVQHLSGKLAFYQETSTDKSAVQRVESRVRELEMRLDLEDTSRTRLEAQLARLKNTMASLQDDRDSIANRESRLKQDMGKRERQLKEYREEFDALRKQEAEHKRKKEEMESDRESREELLSVTKTELNLATKRIRDLQEALEQEMRGSSSDDFYSDGESDDNLSYSSSKRSRETSFRQEPRSSLSLDRKSSSGQYERSNRLRRRLDALEDEISPNTVNRSKGTSLEES